MDQARSGAWSIFDYEKRQLQAYGDYSFPTTEYTYAQAIVGICDLVKFLVLRHNISAVFIEDIQLRKNVDSFKKLAQLQGALIAMFECEEYLYDYIPPTKWQSFCNARGRTAKEIKSNIIDIKPDKHQSKVLSIQFVADKFNVVTYNDNVSDSICMGYYVCENIEIRRDKNA